MGLNRGAFLDGLILTLIFALFAVWAVILTLLIIVS